MDMTKILQGFKDIADNQALLHEEAMICAHRINLNGLKRMHRHYAKKSAHHGLCIPNFAQDHGMEVKLVSPKGGYKMSDLKEHLTKFIPKIEADMEELKKLNSAVMQECGIHFKDGVEMLHGNCKLWSKMKFRWLPRFEFTKWSPEDIVEWDKWLHDKFRCKEEHGGGHHNCPHCHQHKS